MTRSCYTLTLICTLAHCYSLLVMDALLCNLFAWVNKYQLRQFPNFATRWRQFVKVGVCVNPIMCYKLNVSLALWGRKMSICQHTALSNIRISSQLDMGFFFHAPLRTCITWRRLWMLNKSACNGAIRNMLWHKRVLTYYFIIRQFGAGLLFIYRWALQKYKYIHMANTFLCVLVI